MSETKLDPGALKAMMASATSSDGRPAASIRRKLSFVLPAELCSDNITSDLEITIGSLTAQIEIEAARASKGDQMTMALYMAKYSLMAVNGTPLSKANGEGEWLWENIGTVGRNLVMGQYSQLISPDEEALKKALASTKIL